MSRDKQWTIALEDGRHIIVGASVDDDRGVWLLLSAPLHRWLWPDDARRITGALLEAAAHLDANPLGPRTRRTRRR